MQSFIHFFLIKPYNIHYLDCPIWSSWNLEMDRCWRGEFWYDGLFEHRNPDCNKHDHYAEFRKCYMGGIKARFTDIDKKF